MSIKLRKMLASFMAICTLLAMIPMSAMASTEGTNVAQVGDNVYQSIQAAVEAAESGATITVITDHTLTWEPAECENQINKVDHALIYVNKDVTIDLNGHSITADATSVEGTYVVVYVEDGGKLKLTDTSSGGGLAVTGGSEHVAALMMANGANSELIVENGNYSLDDCSGDAMIYATDSKTITIKGGNFELKNTGTRSNLSPWIFNVSGQNHGRVNLEGGTFNAEVTRQFWTFEVQMPDGTKALKEDNGTWSVVDAAAYVNKQEYSGGKWYTLDVGYATLKEAVNAVNVLDKYTYTSHYAESYENHVAENPEVITLLADGGEITGGTVNGFIDLNGHTLAIRGGNFVPAVEGEEVFYLNNCVQEGHEATWNAETGLWEVRPSDDDVTLKITRQPESDKNVLFGDWAKVSVEAQSTDAEGNANGNLKYTWYFCDSADRSFQKSTINTAEYSVVLQDSRATRELYCVITDDYGNRVQSETVRLVNYSEEFMAEHGVKLTAELNSDDVAIGETATVSVVATGDGLKYAWYYRDTAGKGGFIRSTIQGSEYILTVTEARAGREIYCVVTDVYGNTVTTNTVSLNKVAELAITKQPETDADAQPGDVATVTIEATGDVLKYTWYYRDSESADWRTSTIKDSVYSITVKDAYAYRQLKCVVTDAHGNSAESEVVNLITVPEFKITKQPTDAGAALGETVSTSVEATGHGLKYTWYYRDANRTNFSRSSITKNVYAITMKESWVGRQVYCVITNAIGEKLTTNTVTLGLEVPDYFESLSDAFSGEEGSADSTGASVAVVEKDGEKTVTLLNDIALTETLNIDEDATLKLNGYEITYDNMTVSPAIRTNADVVIDGTVEGSAITVNAVAGKKGTILSAKEGELTVNGGSYTSNTSGAGTVNSYAYAVYTYAGTTLNVNDAIILATDNGKGFVNGIHALGDAVVKNSTVIAEANYTGNAAGNNYGSSSRGIYSEATLELYDCYVWGAHSGITTKGSVYVDGGTYEGFGHGGFYLAGGSKTSYFYNATISWAPMRDGFTYDNVAGTNGAGMYISGESYIKAYFDNCKFNMNEANGETWGGYKCALYAIAVNNGYNEVYISNSYINYAGNTAFRLQKTYAGRYVYYGVGNTYNEKNVKSLITSGKESQLKETNESYAK